MKGNVLVFCGSVELTGIDTSPKESNPVRNGGILASDYQMEAPGGNTVFIVY